MKTLILLMSFGVAASATVDYDYTTFSYQIGSRVPEPETSTITSMTTSQITSLGVRTTGQSWLFASLSSTATPSTLTISVMPIGLTPGTYTGMVEVYSPRMANTLATQITLIVTA